MHATFEWQRVSTIITELIGPHWEHIDLIASIGAPLVTILGPGMETKITHDVEKNLWRVYFQDISDSTPQSADALDMNGLAELLAPIINSCAPKPEPGTAHEILNRALADSGTLGLGQASAQADDSIAIWKEYGEQLTIVTYGTTAWCVTHSSQILARDWEPIPDAWCATSADAARQAQNVLRTMRWRISQELGYGYNTGAIAHAIAARVPDAAPCITLTPVSFTAQILLTRGSFTAQILSDRPGTWTLILNGGTSANSTRSVEREDGFPIGLIRRAAEWLRTGLLPLDPQEEP